MADSLTLVDAPQRLVTEAAPAAASYLDLQADHARLVQMVDSFVDATREQRERARQCRRYVNGHQWTDKEIAVLKRRKQPIITANYMRDILDWYRGHEESVRTDPDVLPRNPQQDPQEANAATDTLRAICDEIDFDSIRGEFGEGIVVEGEYALDITVVDNGASDGPDIVAEPIPYDRLIRDPHSRKDDASDAGFLGCYLWMDRSKALRKWPGAENAINGAQDQRGYSSDSMHDDRPSMRFWFDSQRKRVRIVSLQYQDDDGRWMRAEFTAAGFLTPPAPTGYLDELGHDICSIVVGANVVEDDNGRRGIAWDWISPQDEINKRRSKALHLTNSRQTKGVQDAVQDVQAMKEELHKPDGHVEYREGGEWDVIPTTDIASANLQLMQIAMGDLQRFGPSPALMGDGPRDASGRALQAQQQGGEVKMKPFISRVRKFSLSCYRQFWLRARQFWTAARWIRVTDDERNVRFVGLNRPVTLRDALNELPSEQATQVAQDLGLSSEFDPRLNQVVRVDNNIASIEVDIHIDEGPDVATLQQEQFQSLAEFAKMPGSNVQFTDLVELSTLRNKDKLLERAKSGPPPEVQQMQQQMQALQQQMADLKAGHDLKERELQIKAYAAETDRLKVTQPMAGLDPQGFAMLVAQSVRQALASPDLMPGPAPTSNPIQVGPAQPQALPAGATPPHELPQVPDGELANAGPQGLPPPGFGRQPPPGVSGETRASP